MKQVAALKRCKLTTVRGYCRRNLPLLKVGRQSAVWMSQVIDARIPWTLTEEQAAQLVEIPESEFRSMYRKSQMARAVLGGYQDPEVSAIKSSDRRREIRAARSVTGRTPPVETGYKYYTLKELDMVAINYRNQSIVPVSQRVGL